MKVIDDKERAEAAGIHQAETADGRTAQPAQPGAAVAVETDLGTPTAAPGAPEEAASAADLPLSAPDGEAEARAGGHVSDEITAIVEALVFASPDPVTLKTLCKLLETEPKEDVEAALEALQADYARPGGLQLVQVAGGYQIVTRPELHEWVRRLFHERKTQKLSVQALETLAVIAYKQPVTAPEIAEIRGVNTAGVLSTLLERHLIKIAGRKPVVGRPFLYATTREFLIRFGLRDLSDLPKIEDVADLLGFEPPAGLTEIQPADLLLPLEPGTGPAADEPVDDAADESGKQVH
jgi:segregation and condensation protein B